MAFTRGRVACVPPPGFVPVEAAMPPDGSCLVFRQQLPPRPAKPLFAEGPGDLRSAAFAATLSLLLVRAGGLSPLDWARAEAAGLAALPGFKVRFLEPCELPGGPGARAQFTSFAAFRLERLVAAWAEGPELVVAALDLPRSRDVRGWAWLAEFAASVSVAAPGSA